MFLELLSSENELSKFQDHSLCFLDVVAKCELHALHQGARKSVSAFALHRLHSLGSLLWAGANDCR